MYNESDFYFTRKLLLKSYSTGEDLFPLNKETIQKEKKIPKQYFKIKNAYIHKKILPHFNFKYYCKNMSIKDKIIYEFIEDLMYELDSDETYIKNLIKKFIEDIKVCIGNDEFSYVGMPINPTSLMRKGLFLWKENFSCGVPTLLDAVASTGNIIAFREFLYNAEKETVNLQYLFPSAVASQNIEIMEVCLNKRSHLLCSSTDVLSAIITSIYKTNISSYGFINSSMIYYIIRESGLNLLHGLNLGDDLIIYNIDILLESEMRLYISMMVKGELGGKNNIDLNEFGKVINRRSAVSNNFSFVIEVLDELYKKSNKEQKRIFFESLYGKVKVCKYILSGWEKINEENQLGLQFPPVVTYVDYLLQDYVRTLLDSERRDFLKKSVINFINLYDTTEKFENDLLNQMVLETLPKRKNLSFNE